MKKQQSSSDGGNGDSKLRQQNKYGALYIDVTISQHQLVVAVAVAPAFLEIVAMLQTLAVTVSVSIILVLTTSNM